MRAVDVGFWGRITLTSAVVNVPIAWHAIASGTSITTAAVASGAIGAVVCALWAPARRPQTRG